MTDLEFQAELAVYKCKRCAQFGHLEIECGLLLARPSKRSLSIIATALFFVCGLILGAVIERMFYS